MSPTISTSCVPRMSANPCRTELPISRAPIGNNALSIGPRESPAYNYFQASLIANLTSGRIRLMPRQARKSNGETNGRSGNAGARADGVAPYFRPIFTANRKLLKVRSNKELLKRWLEDHPDFKKVPDNVKTGLANLKSVLRKSLRKRRGRQAAAEGEAGTSVAVATKPLFSKTRADSKLEQLEMQIDDCLSMAKLLDREGLDTIIKILRRARNAVVWKLGGEE